MLVWEMVNDADRKQDLVQSGVYPAWFHELFRSRPKNIRVDGDSVKSDFAEGDFPSESVGLLPFSAAWDSPDEELWCPALREVWERGIHTLRFAVGQKCGVKTRKVGIDAETARHVWFDYVCRVRILVRFHKGKFARHQTAAAPVVPLLKAGAVLDERQRGLALSVDAFFQKAFASLIDGLTPQHFCQDCRCALEATTPTGRPSRASICPKCSFARWKRKKGEDAVREQWKKDKKNEREQSSKDKTNERKGARGDL